MRKIRAVYKNHMGDDLSVVNSARVSYGKQKDLLDEKDEKLIKYLAKHKHYTPFEHCVLSVSVSCPLYIRSQIMRHRTFSYNEVSRRYTSENIDFYIPESYRKQHFSSKQCSNGQVKKELNQVLSLKTEVHHQSSVNLYNEMISAGVARELARGVLPQNLMTEFYMTGNLRNWVHFVKLRADSHAQEEAQWIAEDIVNELNRIFPKSSKALMESR